MSTTVERPPSPPRPPLIEEIRSLPSSPRRHVRFWLFSGLLFVLLGIVIGFLVLRTRPSTSERSAPTPERTHDASGG